MNTITKLFSRFKDDFEHSKKAKLQEAEFAAPKNILTIGSI